jgi:hypothetical protein
VSVSTANGTALSGTDYTALSATTVTFAAGETTKVVTIPVAPKPAGTPTRRFSLLLAGPSANVVIADPAAAVDLLGP